MCAAVLVDYELALTVNYFTYNTSHRVYAIKMLAYVSMDFSRQVKLHQLFIPF